MKSSNPAFREKVFTQAAEGMSGEVMTLDGTSVKAGVLGALVVMSAAWPWHLFFAQHASLDALTPYIWGGSLSAFVVALITIFNQKASPITAPLYAVLEGLALGAISAFYEFKFPGVAVPAVGITFSVLGVMLFAYTTHIVRPSAGFLRAVAMATGGIAVYYVIAMIMALFGMHAPLIYNSGIIGICFSLVVSVVAALNLLIDFDFIDKNVQQGAPKYMEWYSAFGLMLTLVWLYLEILRLMSKLSKK